MSADNGIYVLRTLKRPIISKHGYINQECYEWRVANSSDSMMYDLEETQDKLLMAFIFADSEVYNTYEDAMTQACKINEEISYTEYGICNFTINEFFPYITARAAQQALGWGKDTTVVDFVPALQDTQV